jgi:multidrug efflux pump subunit AcrA (membrane-fusion protein)
MWDCSPGEPTSWTARTTTVTDIACFRTPALCRRAEFIFGFLLLLFVTPSLYSQGLREKIRETAKRAPISGEQAKDVTLTVSAVEARPVQQIVRAGGTIDKSHKVVTATITTAEGSLIQVGQRVKSFPPESKGSMYQARVTRVSSNGGKTFVDATLSGEGIDGRVNYVMEITVDRGTFLCIPNEAIIEEGDRRIVYVEEKEGSYVPKKVETGIQGELYTQVTGGLQSGEKVVTFGSFFIDANYKLKGDVGK